MAYQWSPTAEIIISGNEFQTIQNAISLLYSHFSDESLDIPEFKLHEAIFNLNSITGSIFYREIKNGVITETKNPED